jgi:hypothetical protein
MHVGENFLLHPRDALRVEEIEVQLKWWERLAGGATTMTLSWAVTFSILVWTVVGYNYPWSPLSWLGPLGVIAISSGVASAWHKRKLHTEKRRLFQRADQFVISDDALNILKSDLQELANSTLASCVIPEQEEEVLSAYHTAAQELMHLDKFDLDTTQNEVTENFQEIRNTLRIIGDKIAGERERSLL